MCSYVRVCVRQIENWSNNPDAFVEDEDEDSFAYSVRISAQDLLLVRNYYYYYILLFICFYSYFLSSFLIYT